MAYVILELQTNASGQTATPPLVTETDHDIAKQKYFQVCAAASVSSVPVHTVLLMNEVGETERKEVCVHEQPAEPVE